MKKLTLTLGTLVIVLCVGLYMRNSKAMLFNKEILSFKDCADAGYPIMESYPRQCKTQNGLTFTEEKQEKITYTNASVDLITVDLPFPGAVTGKTFSIKGKARGTWYFEASFPVEIVDMEGKTIASGPAHAQGDWMTNDFVPYNIDIQVAETFSGPAKVILKKDNPSGEPSREASISFPITIEY